MQELNVSEFQYLSLHEKTVFSINKLLESANTNNYHGKYGDAYKCLTAALEKIKQLKKNNFDTDTQIASVERETLQLIDSFKSGSENKDIARKLLADIYILKNDAESLKGLISQFGKVYFKKNKENLYYQLAVIYSNQKNANAVHELIPFFKNSNHINSALDFLKNFWFEDKNIDAIERLSQLNQIKNYSNRHDLYAKLITLCLESENKIVLSRLASRLAHKSDDKFRELYFKSCFGLGNLCAKSKDVNVNKEGFKYYTDAKNSTHVKKNKDLRQTIDNSVEKLRNLIIDKYIAMGNDTRKQPNERIAVYTEAKKAIEKFNSEDACSFYEDTSVMAKKLKYIEFQIRKISGYANGLNPDSMYSPLAHNSYLFCQSTAKSATIGGAVGGSVAGLPAALAGGAVAGGIGLVVGFPETAVGGAVIGGVAAGFSGGLAGGVLGALPGMAHGFFRAVTRKPLNVEEQNQLFNWLNTDSRSISVGDKEEFIKNIIRKYDAHNDSKSFCGFFTAFSNSSIELLKVLKSDKIGFNKKWEAIEDYMSEPFSESNPLLKNNGKKLFSIIYDEMQQTKGLNQHSEQRKSPQLIINDKNNFPMGL